jgi:hypothetical protein
VVIDAVNFTHQQTVESPVPVTVPDPEQPDVLHLALLFPGGTGLNAIGTYSGVKPRAVAKTALVVKAMQLSMTLLPQYEYPQVWSLSSTNTSMPVAATVNQ